ncbi:unnamed protein product [Gongylonema pulchrum]|uniref:Uncharacterized protein n=1 Tax=Gongylonema pulchrum TaxID=637853 RepID=A0A183EQ80_9BILA|nr:unnamed protein product [Gongylonema pulchrum]
MLSKWAGRGAALFVGYLLIHFVLIVVDNRRVIDRTQVAVGKDSDGPLIVRTAKDLSSKKNTSASMESEISHEVLVPEFAAPVTREPLVIHAEFAEVTYVFRECI